MDGGNLMITKMRHFDFRGYDGVVIGVAMKIDAPNQGDLDELWDKEISGMNRKLPVTITMPCGNTMVLKSIASDGRVNVPCPCGNSNHMIVKYYE